MLTGAKLKEIDIEDETFPAEIYENRRKQLLDQLEANSIVVLFSANIKHRNNDIDFQYRQESNFYYLTGWDEQEAIAVLLKGDDPSKHAFVIFCQEKDKKKEVWTGPRIGPENAKKIYRANEAFLIEQFKEKFPPILEACQKIYYSMKDGNGHVVHPEFEATLQQLIGELPKESVMPMVHEMRLIKDAYEIACINKAIEISAKGHFRTMLLTNENMQREYEIEAEFAYPIVKNGARSVGYSNIVATGENCCILHYTHNDAKIKKDKLTLMDAGAEFKNYTADITRTFPINGKFSPEQKAIYELVLKAQEAGIKQVFPGTTWKGIEFIVVRVLTEGLMKLGILEGQDLDGQAFEDKLDEHMTKQTYKPFYMHRAGHWMGLDVHDSGFYSKPANAAKTDKYFRIFEPNMVITMEPGIYIAPDTPNVHPRWYDIGVRIEDDLLVTSRGCIVLSDYLPRKVADIEAIMAGEYKLTDNRLMDFHEYEKLVTEKRFQKSMSSANKSGNVLTLFPMCDISKKSRSVADAEKRTQKLG